MSASVGTGKERGRRLQSEEYDIDDPDLVSTLINAKPKKGDKRYETGHPVVDGLTHQIREKRFWRAVDNLVKNGRISQETKNALAYFVIVFGILGAGFEYYTGAISDSLT